MASVEVIGGTKSKRELAYEFVPWLADKLVGKTRSRKLEVTIKFDNMLKTYLGEMDYEDPDRGYPKEFTIVVNRKSDERETYLTIAHEMVHVKQTATGERVTDPKHPDKVLWKNTDHTKTKYNDQPWEIEAYKLQESLVKEFLYSKLKRS